MTDRLITDMLAERLLKWRPAPDRFMTGRRNWIRRSLFQPLRNVNDALRLVRRLGNNYTLVSASEGCTVEVRFSGRLGRATASHEARAITLAVAQVVDLDAAISIGSKSRAIAPARELKLTREGAR